MLDGFQARAKRALQYACWLLAIMLAMGCGGGGGTGGGDGGGGGGDGGGLTPGNETLAGTVTIKGTDTSGNPTPVSGATVSAGSFGSTTTIENGSYSLGSLPVGTITLTVTATGFKPYAAEVSIVQGAQNTHNVALELEGGSTISPVRPPEPPNFDALF